MENRTRMQRLSAFLAGAAIVLFLCLILTLAAGSHFVTAHESIYDYPMEDLIVYWKDQPVMSLLTTVGMLAILLVMTAVIRKYTRFHMEKLCYALWIIMIVCFLWAIRIQPRADFKVVTDAALLFAQGDYSPLSDTPYFSNSTYQLGICLIMEVLKRLFPWIDLALTMQILNVFLTISAVYAIGRLTVLLTGNNEQKAAVHALYLLFWPMAFYCIYVYGTIPMVMALAWSLLYYVRYIRNRKKKDGILFSALMGLSVVFKPNAMIMLAAVAITALLYILETKRADLLGYTVLAAGMAVFFPKLIASFYEWRSGIRLSADISMLARLVMGFQWCSVAPGWYNGYIEPFSPSLMPPQEANAILLSDLRMQMNAFFNEPASLWRFLKEKCMSQWLEPTYSTFWNASLCEKAGRFNGLAYLIFREESSFSCILERIMDAFQQAMYVLAAAGGLRALRKRRDAAQALLPIIVLGGFLYHMLFEAKSQYIYVYAFFLMPLAAQGLSMLYEAIGGWLRKKRGASS